MTDNSRYSNHDPDSEFDQAVIAYLETTNPDVATWVNTTLFESQSMRSTAVIDTEGMAIDPADDAAVEQVATAIEAWVTDIGLEPSDD